MMRRKRCSRSIGRGPLSGRLGDRGEARLGCRDLRHVCRAHVVAWWSADDHLTITQTAQSLATRTGGPHRRDTLLR